MAIIFNGVQLKTINVNGSEMQTVNANGVMVYKKYYTHNITLQIDEDGDRQLRYTFKGSSIEDIRKTPYTQAEFLTKLNGFPNKMILGSFTDYKGNAIDTSTLNAFIVDPNGNDYAVALWDGTLTIKLDYLTIMGYSDTVTERWSV